MMRRNPQVYNSNGRIKEPFSEIEIKKKTKTHTHKELVKVKQLQFQEVK